MKTKTLQVAMLTALFGIIIPEFHRLKDKR